MNGSQRLALVFLGFASFLFWLNNVPGSSGAGRSRLDDVIDAIRGNLAALGTPGAGFSSGGSWSGKFLDASGNPTGQGFTGNAISGQPVILPPMKRVPTPQEMATPPRFKVQGF